VTDEFLICYTNVFFIPMFDCGVAFYRLAHWQAAAGLVLDQS